MRARSTGLLGALAVTAVLAVSACGATADKSTSDAGATKADAKPATGLQLMVPNSPGGGYDTTARTAAKVMEGEKVTGQIQVFNLPGAGGTVSLPRRIGVERTEQLARSGAAIDAATALHWGLVDELG